jgi:hypothetical protein
VIVTKFGGTSVADADALERLGAIVRARSFDKPLVVVSALAGVSDRLAIEGVGAYGFAMASHYNLWPLPREFVLRDGRVLDGKEALALADIPDRDTLHAQIASVIAGPLRGIASVLNATPSGLARVLQARADQLEA